MKREIGYFKEALRDLKRLDAHNRKMIIKAINKAADGLLPPPDGIGKPLGNHTGLRPCCYYKIRLKNTGQRVVYKLITEGQNRKILIISIREDEAVYKEAERRVHSLAAEMD